MARKKHTETVADRIAAYRTKLAEAELEKQKVTDRWLNDRGNAKLVEERESLKQECEFYTAAIEREERLLAEAARRDSAEAVAEQTRRLDAEFAAIEQRLRHMAELDAKFVEMFENISVVLAERQRLADDNQSAGHSIARGCLSGDAFERAFTEQLRRQLRVEDARGALIDSVYASGLGRVGFDGHPWIDISAARSGMSFAELHDRAKHRALNPLSQLIEQRKQKLAAKSDEQPA